MVNEGGTRRGWGDNALERAVLEASASPVSDEIKYFISTMKLICAARVRHEPLTG